MEAGTQAWAQSTQPLRQQTAEPPPPRQWRLLRNCSLRPAQLLAGCCAPGLLGLLVALPFMWQGDTWIAVFAGLQLSCLLFAALGCGMHALDGDVLSIDEGQGRLQLECRRGRRVQRHNWPLQAVRLLPANLDGPRAGLLLPAGGREHLVGLPTSRG